MFTSLLVSGLENVKHLFLVAQHVYETLEYYRDLYNWEEVRDQAIEAFKCNKHRMMFVAAYTVAKDLHLE